MCSQMHDLNQHIADVHEGKKPFKYDIFTCSSSCKENKCLKCKKCNQSSHNFKCEYFDNLKLHIETVHEGEKPFKCKLCDRMCSQIETLDQHVADIHEGKKPFKCKKCNKSSHNFKCEIFDDRMKDVHDNLKPHIETVHEGKKPFKCKLCDKVSSQIENLNQHVADNHEERKPFICVKCTFWNDTSEGVTFLYHFHIISRSYHLAPSHK